MDQGQGIEHAERPGDHHGFVGAKARDQFADIGAPAVRLIAPRRNIALALAARIERDHPPGSCQVIDLLLPDPGRHAPSRHQHDRPSASGLDVMQADMVGGFEVAVVLGHTRATHCRQARQAGHEDCDDRRHAVN